MTRDTKSDSLAGEKLPPPATVVVVVGARVVVVVGATVVVVGGAAVVVVVVEVRVVVVVDEDVVVVVPSVVVRSGKLRSEVSIRVTIPEDGAEASISGRSASVGTPAQIRLGEASTSGPGAFPVTATAAPARMATTTSEDSMTPARLFTVPLNQRKYPSSLWVFFLNA
ncbi:MAG: hypothetical protein V3W06_09420 [Acidimicrobiia bacterium]